MARIRDNIKYIADMHNADPNQLKRACAYLTDYQCETLCEICLNILRGHIPLSRQGLGHLRKYRHKIRYMADRKKNLKVKKRIVQNGSGIFVPLLISALAPLIHRIIDGSRR